MSTSLMYPAPVSRSLYLMLCATFCSLAPSTAFARLGETRAECETRYGQPFKVYEGENKIEFRANDMQVFCTFMGANADAVCEHIGYNSLKGLASPMSLEQVETLLKANSQGKKWSRPTQERTPLGVITKWQREDGAIGRSVLGGFNIMAPSKIKRDEDERRKKEGDSLKGF